MKFSGKSILIVGASSGMGRVLALRLAAEGAKIAVTARRAAHLDTLAYEIRASGGQCLAVAADATDPALDMRLMSADAVSAYMRSNYDVVVNYLFPALQQMILQGGGHVGHTNSLAGLLGVPMQGPYSAAKGAAMLLIDTCRIEFARYGIRFTTVYPGFVATEITMGDGMPAPLEISMDKAVDHIIYALRHEKRDYMFPMTMRWVLRLARILPKPVVLWILSKMLPDLPDLQEDAAPEQLV